MMSTEVVRQGDVIENIADAVVSADQDMDEGLDELLKA